MKAFETICPDRYAETNPARLPAEQLAQVMKWQPGPMGLLLCGPSRTCKTRCMWTLIRRIMVEDRIPEEQRRVLHYDAIGWTLAVAAAWGEPANTERWLERVCRAPILFLDDMLKGKLTDAQEMALYGVLERRTSRKLPTLATTNTTGKMLLARVSSEDDRGTPIIERMREFFTIVNFYGAKSSEGPRPSEDVPTSGDVAPTLSGGTP